MSSTTSDQILQRLRRRKRAVAAAQAEAAVRRAGGGTLVIADRYSCREQIVQSTRRDVVRLAEVLARALPSKGALP